ncbi:MAG: hypothetical protein HZY75_06830 [Nocardioidaceae bacterium]|nr:MAG: hypothetical protein HZY75_06830 [Nocardioidaceae bacterium]
MTSTLSSTPSEDVSAALKVAAFLVVLRVVFFAGAGLGSVVVAPGSVTGTSAASASVAGGSAAAAFLVVFFTARVVVLAAAFFAAAFLAGCRVAFLAVFLAAGSAGS